ncbi:hypothetical protein [Gaetbulibacter aestuarii]|uniref:Uncharacterized protein n=1 Tax=Gaetbulibacter aestuarii TaxID=1502358 RepID=A0ABW7MWZ7_9FLAO
MKTIQSIEDKILKLTDTIENDYPELYAYLDENPVTMPSLDHPNITVAVMEDYLKSLQQILKHHIETHKK